MVNECAVCGEQTDVPEHWGRHVCGPCSQRPVLFAARCNRWDCHWTGTADGREYKRGEAKQHIQMLCNQHERTRKAIHDDPDHTAEWWEIDHPDREAFYPSEAES